MQARKALTWIVVIKAADMEVPPPAYMTAASTPRAQASAQEIAVMTCVSMPISSAVNSLEAVARTPRPHLLYLSSKNSTASTTAVMARQITACLVMTISPPRAGMTKFGEMPALTVL